MSVEIPDSVAAAIAPEGTDAARRMLEDAVAQAYRDGRFTMHQVQMALGLPTRMHVDPFLMKYKIFDYTPEMLEQDFAYLQELSRCSS